MAILKSSTANNALCPFASLSIKNFRWFVGIFPNPESLTVCKTMSKKKFSIIPSWSISVKVAPVISLIGFVPSISLKNSLTKNCVMRCIRAQATDAKRYFSKSGCPAYGLGSDYDRFCHTPEYLETAIDWISKGNIEVLLNRKTTPTPMLYGCIFSKSSVGSKRCFPPTAER